MTVAQNESFPIPTPWMIMKTEDGTNFIHLLTRIVTGLKAAATNPSEVTVSQTHSHHVFKKTTKTNKKTNKTKKPSYRHSSWESSYGEAFRQGRICTVHN